MTENKRRQFLKRATVASVLLMIAAFLYVIFQGLLWSPVLTQEQAYATLTEGETRMERQGQQRYWVTKISDKQREQLLELAQFVAVTSGCSLDSNVCVLEARSQRAGVLIQFVLKRPAQLSSSIPWYSGFVDPSTGGVYDLLGRAYLSNSSDAFSQLNVKQM